MSDSDNKSEAENGNDSLLPTETDVDGGVGSLNPGSSDLRPNPTEDTANLEEATTSEVKSDEVKSIIEYEASEVFKQFVYMRMKEGVKSKDEDEGNLPDHEWGEDRIAYEIGRQLARIGEDIDKRYKDEFDSLIDNLMREALGRRSYVTFMWAIRKFIEILKNSVNFPISLIRVSFETLIAIWLNPRVLGKRDTVYVDVPDSSKNVIEDLEEMAIKTYLKALINVNETARHIRIMVIGMFRAGKTSLVQNLLNLEKVELESTDGIDIHIDECIISENDEWLFKENSSAEITDYRYRVAAMMSKSKISDKSVVSSDHGDVIYERVKDSQSETKDRKQTCVSAEDISQTKAILDAFKQSDPVLDSYLKDIYDAWNLLETNSKEGKGEITSSTQATVSVWDFAGQDVYYSTHHFFMNPASVYLLVMNINKPLNNKLSASSIKSNFTHFHTESTYLDAFKFWLNSVHTYSAKYGENSPTVILVGTHIDELEGTPQEKLKKGEDYFDEALKSFINSRVLQHVHPKKFFVDNTDPDEDFTPLRTEILELARKSRGWNQVVPARWILLERSLEQLRSEGKEMITISELMNKDSENEYPVGNMSELKEFLRFHHSLGNLLYFDTEPLANHIILSPQWIVDAFRCFVTSFPKKDPADLKLWDEYEKQAKLSPTLLHSIIAGNTCLADYKDEVVKYMEYLDIMAQPSMYLTEEEIGDRNNKGDRDQATHDTRVENGDENVQKNAIFDCENVETNVREGEAQTERKMLVDDQKVADGSTGLEVKTEKLDFHIVPSMLSAKPSDEFMEHVVNPTQALKTSVLCFKFSGEFLPPAIFHRLVAVCINNWPVSTREKQFLLYRGLAVFSLTPSMELVIWMHEYVIFCRIAFYTSICKEIPNDKCIEVRKFINSTLQKLLGIYKDKWSMVILPFEEYIHCDQAKDPLLGLVAVRDLTSQGEAVYKAQSSVHVLKSEDALAHWYPESSEVASVARKTLEIDLTKVPTEKELVRLSSKIGHEYFRLGLELGLSVPIIQHCQENHKFDLRSIINSVLNKWKEANGIYASLDKLKAAMEMVECDMGGFYEVFGSKHLS